MFEISYQRTDGNEVTKDLLAENSSLAKRFRILDNKKEQITLLNKIQVGLLLIASFIWNQEKAIDGFFSFQNKTSDFTELELMRSTLFEALKKIISNETKRNDIAKILRDMSAVRTDQDGLFIIPINSEETHDFSSITDEQIAKFFQQAVVNELSLVIKLIP